MKSFGSADLMLLAAVGGVSAHILIFRVGEWDKASVSVAAFHVAAFLVAAATSYLQFNVPVAEAAKVAGCYLVGLYSSMLVYRAFFHRLGRYPGPFLARLSNFYITARSMKKMHLFKEVQKLHSQYGDYVRLGKELPILRCSQPVDIEGKVLLKYPSRHQRLSKLSMEVHLQQQKGIISIKCLSG